MKISLIQPDTVWENKTENFRALEKLITPLFGETDMVILPELFSTGFSMKPETLGESPGEETFVWMKKIALAGNFGICGSYMVRDRDNFHNRFIFVSPEEAVWHYDKRHLFSMGEENNFFTRGTQKLVFSFRGVRISPFICYDLRFPVWSRSRKEVDLIIYSSNWPVARKEVWNTLTRARAIENQCYVAGVNRVGTDGNQILYCGDSRIVHPYGDIIAGAGPDIECSVTGEISMNELSEFRRKFPVLDDADDFALKV
jgi:predicted amidohydrolase